MKLSKIRRNSTFWILAGFVFLGFILRIYSFDSITFGYDQARDAIISYNIWKGDLKILGPASDIAGLHHGILYWYIISPFYYFSNLNAFVVKLFLVIASLSVIPLVYFLARDIFKNKSISLLAAFMCAVSFELIQYSHWFANPSLAVITITLSFLFLWKYVHGARYGIYLTFFFWALSVHFEIFLLYQLAVFFIILLLYKKIKILDLLISFIISGIVLSPFLVAEIKFNFAASKGILSFFQGYSQSRGQTVGEMAERVSGKLIFLPYNNVLSSIGASYVIVFLLSAVSIYSIVSRDKRITFLFLWFIFPTLLFFTGATNIYFAFIGSAIPLSILLSYYMHKLFIEKKVYALFYLVLLIVFTSNVALLIDSKGQGETLFSVQHGMVLSDEKSIIDWIYKEANGKPFRINTITNPLFINTTWTYLFDWYGKGTYGYMPFWWGYPQNGRIGEEIPYSTNFKGSSRFLFLIIEPHEGIPDYYINALIKVEDQRSLVVAKKQIGNIIVEKREIVHDQPFLMEDINRVILGH